MRIYTECDGRVYVNAIHQTHQGEDVRGHLYAMHAGIDAYHIKFQHGPVREVGVNGITSECLLAILLDRLTHMNDAFPCDENLQALAGLYEALDALNRRTQARQARGVEGTSQA